MASFPPEVTGAGADFLKHFYRLSDTPSASSAYASLFSHTATLALASQRATGREEISALHTLQFHSLLSRTHTVTQIFAASASTTTENGGLAPDSSDGTIDLMLRGTVVSRLKDGSQETGSWGAYARLRVQGAGDGNGEDGEGMGGEERAGKLGLEEYRVYQGC